MTGVWSGVAALGFAAAAFALPKHDEPVFVDAVAQEIETWSVEENCEYFQLCMFPPKEGELAFYASRRAELEAKAARLGQPVFKEGSTEPFSWGDAIPKFEPGDHTALAHGYVTDPTIQYAPNEGVGCTYFHLNGGTHKTWGCLPYSSGGCHVYIYMAVNNYAGQTQYYWIKVWKDCPSGGLPTMLAVIDPSNNNLFIDSDAHVDLVIP